MGKPIPTALHLGAAGTKLSPKYSCYAHMHALDHDFGFTAPATLIRHSRTCFSSPVYFHGTAEGLFLPITAQIQCGQHSESCQQIHCLTLQSQYKHNSCILCTTLSDTFMQLFETKSLQLKKKYEFHTDTLKLKLLEMALLSKYTSSPFI